MPNLKSKHSEKSTPSIISFSLVCMHTPEVYYDQRTFHLGDKGAAKDLTLTYSLLWAMLCGDPEEIGCNWPQEW